MVTNTIMKVVEKINDLDRALAAARREEKTIGFVPTMGALHAGHGSLIDKARTQCDIVVVSIFVNPLQFGPGEDLEKYPRTRQADLDECEKRGVDYVFIPEVAEMYSRAVLTNIHVAEISEPLCGKSRPGHFDGVCTVVCKLFNIVRPNRAYFGEKDYQQLVIIKRMVSDLSMPVEIVGCEIVREPDGLALSSRNSYLSTTQRRQAPVIQESLKSAADRIRQGDTETESLIRQISRQISEGGADSIEYVSIVDAESLADLEHVDRPARIAVAARFGQTRLIDNLGVDVS